MSKEKVLIFRLEIESSFILKLEGLVEIYFISENSIFEKAVKKNTVNFVEQENITREITCSPCHN